MIIVFITYKKWDYKKWDSLKNLRKKSFCSHMNNNGCFSLQDFLITHTILSSFIINHVKFSQ